MYSNDLRSLSIEANIPLHKYYSISAKIYNYSEYNYNDVNNIQYAINFPFSSTLNNARNGAFPSYKAFKMLKNIIPFSLINAEHDIIFYKFRFKKMNLNQAFYLKTSNIMFYYSQRQWERYCISGGFNLSFFKDYNKLNRSIYSFYFGVIKNYDWINSRWRYGKWTPELGIKLFFRTKII